MAHTWGKLMQERKTKKGAAQAGRSAVGLLAAVTALKAAATDDPGTVGLGEKGENCGQSHRARPSRNQAPRWKGRDCSHRERAVRPVPRWRWVQPFQLCCPMK